MTFNEDVFKNINELINNLPFDVYKENKKLIFTIINDIGELLKTNAVVMSDNSKLKSYRDINKDLELLDFVDYNLTERDFPYGEPRIDCDDDEDEEDFNEEDFELIERNNPSNKTNGMISFQKTEPITKDNVDFKVERTILKHLVKFLYCGADDLEESDFVNVIIVDEVRLGDTYTITKYIPTGHAYCNSNKVDYYCIRELPDLVINGRHRYSINGPLLDERYKSVMCEVYEIASRDEISYSLNYELVFKNF